MPSTNVIPTPASATSQGWQWLKAHERLVMLVLVLLVGGWVYGKYLDASSSKAEVRANAAEQALVSQNETNTKNAAQIMSLTQQYQQLTATLAAQNASLAASLAARQTAQAAQQATDAHLAPSELASRLESLGNAPQGSVTTAPTGLALSEIAAVAVVQTLEQVPVLQADLKDTQAVLGATQAAKAQADTLIASQVTQITGLNAAAVDQTKVCTTQLAVVKAEAKKSKLSWFKRGVIIGFLGGLWAGHAGL